ncbi:hypothetical protein GCM10027440_37540 [Nocardiopsis coralliicola]
MAAGNLAANGTLHAADLHHPPRAPIPRSPAAAAGYPPPQSPFPAAQPGRQPRPDTAHRRRPNCSGGHAGGKAASHTETRDQPVSHPEAARIFTNLCPGTATLRDLVFVQVSAARNRLSAQGP